MGGPNNTNLELYREGRDVIFTIRDFGVGVYENVKKKYKLQSDLEPRKVPDPAA